ncbi:hypothetical protein [Rhodovulum euryhalinum]|nr:hypothetical protein [Rhodovulum euryhalinum]
MAMLDFMTIVDLQSNDPDRPKGYFKRNFGTLSRWAAVVKVEPREDEANE